MLRSICTLSLLSFLLCSGKCLGTFVIIGGYTEDSTGGSNPPTYPLIDTFSIGQTSVTPFALPISGQAAILGVGIDSFRGTVAYAGQSIGHYVPFLFIGSVVSSEIAPISLPSDFKNGVLASVAFDSNGTAFINGENYDKDVPVLLRLPFGSHVATQISAPNVGGYLQFIAIGSNNTVISAGQDPNSAPLICVVPSGSNEAVLVSLSDPSVLGYINSPIGIAPNGTAFLAGQNNSSLLTNGQALIYSLAPGSTTANEIAIPGVNPDDGGIIIGLAVRFDGTVILVGYSGLTGDTRVPLIYKISSGSTSASNIPFPYDDLISFTSVVFDSEGNAIIAGDSDQEAPPVIYRFNLNTSQFTPVQFPDSLSGNIQSIGITDEDVVVFTGEYTNTNHLLLYTLSPGSNTVTAITTPSIAYRDIGYSIGIYNCDGPYDIRHMRPFYYLQLINTENTLNQAGL